MAILESEVVSSAPVVRFQIPDELTTRQKLFISYYLEHKSGTKAAELAGYAGDANTLRSVGAENLSKPAIRSVIESYFKSRIISRDGVLAELSDIASIPVDKMPPALKGRDKIKSLELVGKFHGLFADRSENVNVNIDLRAEDLASILQGALSAGVIDVTGTAIDVGPISPTDDTSRTE